MFRSIRASTPPAVGCQVCLGVFLRTYLRRCTAAVEHDGYECSTHSMQARRQQPQRHINLRGECPQTNRRRRYTEVVEHYVDHGVPHLPCGHAVHTYCCNSCVRRTRGWPRAKVVEQYGGQGVPHHPCGHMSEQEAKLPFVGVVNVGRVPAAAVHGGCGTPWPPHRSTTKKRCFIWRDRVCTAVAKKRVATLLFNNLRSIDAAGNFQQPLKLQR